MFFTGLMERPAHRHTWAVGGSTSGSSHTLTGPRGSVCIRAHSQTTPPSRWPSPGRNGSRLPEHRDPDMNECPE